MCKLAIIPAVETPWGSSAKLRPTGFHSLRKEMKVKEQTKKIARVE